MEKEKQINARAEAYARASTSTRCARMGECQECQIRYCDYRSRVEAFKTGYSSAVNADTTRPNHVPLTPNVQP